MTSLGPNPGRHEVPCPVKEMVDYKESETYKWQTCSNMSSLSVEESSSNRSWRFFSSCFSAFSLYSSSGIMERHKRWLLSWRRAHLVEYERARQTTSPWNTLYIFSSRNLDLSSIYLRISSPNHPLVGVQQDRLRVATQASHSEWTEKWN